MDQAKHIPVMTETVVSLLGLEKRRAVLVDATFGYGGHSRLLMEHNDLSLLIAIDRDSQAVAAARTWASTISKDSQTRIEVVHNTFDKLGEIIGGLGLKGVDGVLMDLGVSSAQLDDNERGFSFMKAGPLDMRMDKSRGITAATLLGRMGEKDLADLIYRYGEEGRSRKIAAAIVAGRQIAPITDTLTLARLIESTVPRHERKHPATRTFQALRIATNCELEILEAALKSLPALLNPGAKVVVISFHSLEDRIVKLAFREWEKSGLGEPVGKSCLSPDNSEVRENPRARSAKLRCFQVKAA